MTKLCTTGNSINEQLIKTDPVLVMGPAMQCYAVYKESSAVVLRSSMNQDHLINP